MKARAGLGLLCAALVAAAGAPFSRAQTIPPEWLRAAPGPREAAAIEQGAARYGWPAMAAALRSASYGPYSRSNLETAEAWRNLARWAAAWGEGRDAYARRRAAALAADDSGAAPATQAPAGEGNASAPEAAPAAPEAPGAPLSDTMPPALREWVLSSPRFSAEYFGLERAEDDRREVFAILARLHAKDAAAFTRLPSLAIAIAVVYDAPPPREWPHWQVTEQALPRRLPDAAAAFEYFVRLEESGEALQKLASLDAAELRFMVDLAAPEADLRWARERVRTPLGRLDETYSAIRYRMDRIQAGAYVWPGAGYSLENILTEGGICVDQAYFATQAAKARGVPSLLFGGAGRDGRHAWFGYLGQGGKWRMDAGRYEEQKFVTGVAIDPQTWREITDHELGFLSENYRNNRPAREAAIHAGFARWLLEDGRAKEAETAARAATRLERRETAAWDLLLELRAQPGAEREALAREAAAGLSSYPDLQARYLDVAVASLRARGETAAADQLGREMARRFAKKRGDLSVGQIAQQLARAAEASTVEEQMRLYRSLLRRFGRGEGAAWWDEVVRPFITRLVMAGRFADARAALGVAQETLAGTMGSQLGTEMRQMSQLLAEAERMAAQAKP